MKKNVMMRLASFLLVAVLISTSAISGTYAKYVTTNSGKDEAQVAKFGVVINVADDLGMFNTAYATEDTSYGGALSVNSSSTARLVAPGTKGSMSFNITGMPEVATRVSIDFNTAGCNAIKLAGGTAYTLPAGAFEAAEKTVTPAADYEPIKFYFGTTAITDATVYDMTLTELQTAMETAFTQDYAPNHNFGESGLTYYLGWSWAFEDTSIADVNFLDTYLGWEAATATAQVEKLDFAITVTQIN